MRGFIGEMVCEGLERGGVCMRGFRGKMAYEGLERGDDCERGGAFERVLRRGIFGVEDAFGFGVAAF